MDFEKEVTQQLTAMGFDPQVISKAYAAADIKTAEGIINYIDAHPEIQVVDSGAMQEESNPNTETKPAENSGAMEEETKPAEPQGVPISGHVNSQLRDNLIAMGYKKNPAEKGLLLTGNKTIQAAIDWMDQNKDEPDFNEPMFLVAPDPSAQQGGTGVKRSDISPEEAKKQAKELQNKIRAKLIAKDKARAEEREADRIRATKEMGMAKRQQKEQELREGMDYLKKEREEKNKAMAKVLEQLEKDKWERTGKRTVKKLKPVKEIISNIYHKMRKVYPQGSMSGSQVNVCFKTCGIYICKNPFFLEILTFQPIT